MKSSCLSEQQLNMLAVFSLVASLLDITLLRQNDLLGKWLTRFFVWHSNIAGHHAKMDSVAIYDYIRGSTMQITTISQKSRADLFFKYFHSSQGQSICFHNFKI